MVVLSLIRATLVRHQKIDPDPVAINYRTRALSAHSDINANATRPVDPIAVIGLDPYPEDLLTEILPTNRSRLGSAGLSLL